jgi:hypothetical protein
MFLIPVMDMKIGCSTMITQNNERSVSYMMQEETYDVVDIGFGWFRIKKLWSMESLQPFETE